MASTHRHTGSNTSDATPCPDPSAHEKSNKLSEQASTAALYVTHPERATETRTEARSGNPLDPDGKLSSKSAATSLKYAKAHELPSFPSHGGSASAAGSAAMLAKDYKMKELWQPELSAAGSKAALQAHNKGGKLDLWQPSASADGNSAATMAMRNKGLSPQIFQGSTDDNKSKALLAATMSVSRNRQRAESTPTTVHPAYPDSHNSASNALSAATSSHRTSAANKAAQDGWDSDAMQAARVQNMHMDPSMFGEHPPVEPEVEEARHNAALRASAITMAKQIMETKNREAAATSSAGQAGAEAAAARNVGTASPDIKQEALRYINLQDAAHKLAAERLAKIDNGLENAKYREYYGYGGNEDKSKRLSSRLSVLGRSGRGRAASDGNDDDLDSDDEREARKIRNQMSQLSTGLNKVDAAKQKDDRARLMAAAEKRVSAQMHSLDERVFLQTGKVPPAMMEEWEEKSRKAAEEKKVERDAAKKGKTHIGGGKYMDQSEIEAIALARLRPTLDEIDRDAAEKRKRDEEERKEREQQEYYRALEKEKNRSQKEEFKSLQRNDKAAAKQEKAEIKAQKDEEKRIAKEEKRKSRHETKDLAAAGAAGATLGEVANKVKNDDEEDETEEAKKRGGLFGSLRGRRNTREEKPKEQHESRDVAAASAAGATLGEVADKVKHDNEEPVDTEDGPSKHFSALTRLKEKFKKDKDHEEVAATETPVATKSEVEPKSTGHTGAGLATGAAAGAVTGLAVADLEHEPKTAIQAPQPAEPIRPEPVVPATSTAVPESTVVPTSATAYPAEPSAQEFEAAQTSANRDWTPVAPSTEAPVATEPAERLETIPAPAIEEAALAAPVAATVGSPVLAEDESDIPTRNQSVHDHVGAPGLLAARPDLERHISTIQDDDSDDLEDSDGELEAADLQNVLGTKKAAEPVPYPVAGAHDTVVGTSGLPVTAGAAALAAEEAAQTSVQFDESDRVGAAPTVKDSADNTGSAAVAAPLALGAAGVPAVDTVPTPVTEKHEPLSTLSDQRVQPKTTTTGAAVVGSGGSIAKDTSAPTTQASQPANEYINRTSRDIQGRPTTAETETGEGEKKGLRGFFSKLKPGHKNKEDPATPKSAVA